ncbi:MAG: molecular chaperone DnaJ [Oligoflexia bacterium]|nr:molecular chaperone DnaJ [Oligoflexia bacterium]
MCVSKRDFYEVLGVAKTATTDEIKKAYRKKALEFHPDRNPGNKAAEEKFKEATSAYQVLSDPDNRRKYDQFGHAAFEQATGGAGFGGFTGDFAGFEDIFGDLFGSFFGAAAGTGARRTRGRSGRDLKYDLEISFEEAAFGAEKEISIERKVMCDSCEGTGAQRGTKPETCSTCGGHGQVRIQQGFFTIARTCHVCGGSGKMVKNPCGHCRGEGLKPLSSKLSVKIPPGIDHGQRLKLRGEGESGVAGGSSGDLYVQIAVREHPFFERQESEIVCEFPIPYSLAVLGGEVEVPTLDGPASLKIPAGTESGKVFRLRNRGVQVLGTTRRGDQHVKVVVKVPKKISEKQRAMIEKLKEFDQENMSEDQKGFFDKVKNIFN